MEKIVNMQCPSKVESDGYLGNVTDLLVVRLQRDIILA